MLYRYLTPTQIHLQQWLFYAIPVALVAVIAVIAVVFKSRAKNSPVA